MILHRFGLSAPAFVCCCLSSRVPRRVLSQSNQVPTSYIKDLNLLLLSSSSSSSRQFFQHSFSSSLSAHLHLQVCCFIFAFLFVYSCFLESWLLPESVLPALLLHSSLSGRFTHKSILHC